MSKEPVIPLTAPQSEWIAVASAAAHYKVWLRRAHAGEEETQKIIAQLELFHQRVVALPGLTPDARRYLDVLEVMVAGGESAP
jgi:hypothetical protein